MKPKILFFLFSYCGGAERITIQIAKYLDINKFDIKFYIIGNPKGNILNFIPDNYPVAVIPIKNFKDFLIFKLAKVIFKEKPRIVFSSLIPINVRLCIVSIFFPKLKVIVRSDNYLYTQSFFQKLRIFFAYRFLDTLIVQTEEMNVEHINKLSLDKSKVITLQNPIDIDLIENKLKDIKSPFAKESQVNFLFVGRIKPVKGLDILLKAFKIVQDRIPFSSLYILGRLDDSNKDYYDILTNQITQLELQDKIKFEGFTDNPYVYMKYANCLVLPSRNEGLPNVLIEALHVGTPVASTLCIPIIRRIIDEGINGYTCNVDDEFGFALAMEKACRLGKVKSNYKSASKDDFINLFNE